MLKGKNRSKFDMTYEVEAVEPISSSHLTAEKKKRTPISPRRNWVYGNPTGSALGTPLWRTKNGHYLFIRVSAPSI